MRGGAIGFAELAVAATRQALEDAKLHITEDNADDIGCVYGTGSGGLQSFVEIVHVFDKEGPRRLHPFAIPMVIDDSAASAIAIDWNLRGPNFAPVSACVAGADAIGLAFRLIRHGDAQAIVAGGTEMPLHALPMAAFDRLGAMSRNNDHPRTACRPFDKKRDGLVMGEGAATLILEELRFAQARGVSILAEVVGYGCTSDAFHVTAPAENGIGAAKAMRRALDDAGLAPADIDWISAHATATDLNANLKRRPSRALSASTPIACPSAAPKR